MRDMAHLALDIPGFPPLSGVVQHLQELPPHHGQLLLIVGLPGIRHLDDPASVVDKIVHELPLHLFEP